MKVAVGLWLALTLEDRLVVLRSSVATCLVVAVLWWLHSSVAFFAGLRLVVQF